MKLQVTRNVLTDKSTIGMLDIDGVFQNYTLEPSPPVVPDGTYPLKMLFSPRFQKMNPHVLDVPGHEGIEIHQGNYPTDTSGCLLVGQQRGTDAIWKSDDALIALMGKLGDLGDDSTITYVTLPK